MRVWFNGSLLAVPNSPVISLTDHGLTVGDGVFESVKVVNNTPFALTRHLTRLVSSATALGLPAPDLAEVRRGVAETLAGQELAFGRIRITYTSGPGPLGSPRGDGPSTLSVITTPAEPMPETTKVITFPYPRNEHGVLAGVKSTSYAENVIAVSAAKAAGASEAMFTNVAGNICEGTGSNVFYVVDGELRTPTLASGCLAGVTRALVIEWCGAREVDEPLSVLDRASEVFLASTTRDVQGVHNWDERRFPAPGPITRAAMQTWAEREAEHADP